MQDLAPYLLRRADVASLYRADRESGGGASLLCLEAGLHSTALDAALAAADWALELVSSLVRSYGSAWLFAQDHQRENAMRAEDLPLLRGALGLDAAPRGNVRLTWSIRTYRDRDQNLGGSQWLEGLMAANWNAPPIARALAQALAGLAGNVRSAGGELFVEQISVLISKDGRLPTRALTPSLHADEYYGRRQSAIATLAEAGWDEHGATIFFPTLSPRELGSEWRMPGELVDATFPAAPRYVPSSGDVVIYDGMQDEHGRKQADRGVPHISGDLPGRSSRLVVLMRHRAPT